MIHIQNRTDLMEYIEGHIDMGAIVTAMTTGTVEHFGNFYDCPRPGYNGYVVRITSQHGPQYLVCVYHREHRTRLIGLLGKIPWRNWTGWQFNGVLHQGDNFEKNLELHLQEFDDAEIQTKRLHQDRGCQQLIDERNRKNPDSNDNL